MKVLLVGSGGREHALGWKIAQSPLLTHLYLAPGNPGLNALGEPIDVNVDNIDEIVSVARALAVDLVVVGPEAPLAAGISDRLSEAGIPCFGPSAAAARLESSKAFMKEIAAAVDAPTAGFKAFKAAAAAKAHLRSTRPPFVVKADGLAAGKGVIIASTLADADAAVDEILGGSLGVAGSEIIIEEFLHGEEVSFFVLTDGEHAIPLIAVQDHKRAFDGDKGPNTGGMGAYAPAAVFTDRIRQQTMSRIIEPVIAEMKSRGTPFKGVLFAGLMIDDDGPKLIEFNARFGDPECQVMMRLLKSDLLPALYSCATGVRHRLSLEWTNEACALVVMAANGYPGAYSKGTEIEGVDLANARDGVVIFQAGTKEAGGRLVANGGRVLNVSATGPTIGDAVRRAYDGVASINWPGGYFRRDIAWRALVKHS